MICLSCFKPITMHNRQDYKAGLRLPYCRDCIRAYLIGKKLKGYSTAARAQYVQEMRKEIQAAGPYTRTQKEDAELQLIKSGFTEDEIKTLLATTTK